MITLKNRFYRWYCKTNPEKLRSVFRWANSWSALVFRLAPVKFRRTYLAYHPDSYSIFYQHEEFSALLKQFIRGNRYNNAGDISRLWMYIINLRHIMTEGIEGDFAELGVWRGNTAAVLAHFASESGRRVWLFDTYDGFRQKDLVGIDQDKDIDFQDTSIGVVRSTLDKNVGACEFICGYFPDSLRPEHDKCIFSAVSIDCDLYGPVKAGLDFFYPRLSVGGILILHDYSSGHWAGAKKAIDEFISHTGEGLVLMPDKSGTAFVKKRSSSFPADHVSNSA